MGSEGVNTLLTQPPTPSPHLKALQQAHHVLFSIYLLLEKVTLPSLQNVALTGIMYVPISLPPSSTASSQH